MSDVDDEQLIEDAELVVFKVIGVVGRTGRIVDLRAKRRGRKLSEAQVARLEELQAQMIALAAELRVASLPIGDHQLWLRELDESLRD